MKWVSRGGDFQEERGAFQEPQTARQNTGTSQVKAGPGDLSPLSPIVFFFSPALLGPTQVLKRTQPALFQEFL